MTRTNHDRFKAPAVGSYWRDPADLAGDRLRVDYVGGWPTKVHYHWSDETEQGETVFGSRFLRDWPFVVELDPAHVDILREVARRNNQAEIPSQDDLYAPEAGARNTFYSRINQLVERGLLTKLGRSELHVSQAGFDYLDGLEEAA